jgi:hypothetical protein
LTCRFNQATDYTDSHGLFLATEFTEHTENSQLCVLNAAFAPNMIRAQGPRFAHKGLSPFYKTDCLDADLRLPVLSLNRQKPQPFMAAFPIIPIILQ